MKKQIIPVILGPTAVGKTAFAIRAAEAFGYEILSCDSRQIYRGMDIGTAKPSLEERALVRHWLIDILDPSEPYSAFAFAAAALRVIRELRENEKKILICGGTGLYYRVLAEGIGADPRLDAADMGLRSDLLAEARERGVGALYERLKSADPAAAKKIHPNNLQRVVRALDVYYRTGRPISSLQEERHPPEDVDFRVLVINRPRDALYDRINRRVDVMFEMGLRDEFQSLRGMGYTEASPGMICVGYRELFAADRGEISIDKAVELIKQNSRHYAKRQMTWFRNTTQGLHVDVSDEDGNFLCDWMKRL